jgi:site-specific DNA-methyltransferase (cytosine-N4-specific)
MATLQVKSTTYYTHGFHPYPAKYIPQIVSKYLSSFCKRGYTILDPFCGSGTTIVEGAINGINSVGIDLNPIAYIVSKAKSNQYQDVDIQLVDKIIKQVRILNTKFSSDIEIPDFPNRNHWFQDNVCIELAKLKSKINLVENENVKDLLWCAFSKIIVRVSNQDSEVRYSAKNKNIQDGTVYNLFIETLLNYVDILETDKYKILAKTEIFNGDTLSELYRFNENYFDFVITSPPYINTFDYYLYHKLRMFWLDYDHRPVRQKEIGNHHRIDTKDFATAKKEYVDSMSAIMNELSRVSKPKSNFVMIIGDGIVDGRTIDMSEVISEICLNSEYKIQSVESVNLSDITRSFNKKFSNAPKKEHNIVLFNNK